MCWEITVTLIGITLTFIVGVINIIVTLRQSNKNTFINTITIARKEYLSMLRKTVAEFCAIAVDENKDDVKLIDLSYQLKMFMNPAGYPDCWDGEAIKLIDRIVQVKNENKKNDIDKLVALMQSWLALEWHGMTNEGKQGILNKKEKNKLRDKFYNEYQKYLKIKNYAPTE